MNGSEERSKTVWLVGASERSQRLGAALCGLGSWGPAAVHGTQVLTKLNDLEELLFGQPERGTLILDYQEVPVEDIGFVRRFLERHDDWRLLVLGLEPGADCAGRLLGLAHAEWISWPPNLDQLEALQPTHGSRAAAKPRGFSPAADPKSEPRAILSPQPPSASRSSVQPEAPSSLNLSKLFKELLINEHLAGYKWALELEESLELSIDPRLVKLSFGAFINLARACAGRDGLVRTQMSRHGLPGDPADTICLQLRFPHGSLSKQDRAQVLVRATQAEGKLGSAAKAALIAAEALRKRGGRVEIRELEGELLCLEMHISSQDLEVLELERLEAEAGASRLQMPSEARAQDPFA